MQTVKVDVSYTVPLVQAVGVSSSYLAQKKRGGVDHEELFSVEEFDYWNQDDFKGKMPGRLAQCNLYTNEPVP